MFISGVISRLKKRYPMVVDFYRVTSRSKNLETGRESLVRERLTIKQAVNMPYDFNFTPGVPLSKPFNFGGFMEAQTATVLIDGRDVTPADFFTKLEDLYAVIGGQKYEITKIQEYPIRLAYIVAIKGLPGASLEQSFEIDVAETFYFGTSLYWGTLTEDEWDMDELIWDFVEE